MRATSILLDIFKAVVNLGKTLYSPAYGYVNYSGVIGNNIVCITEDGKVASFDSEGRLCRDGECMIFESKEKRDWLAYARENYMTCPFFDDFVDFLRRKNLFSAAVESLAESLNSFCWNNVEHPEYWLCGLNITSVQVEDEWHDYAMRKLAE